MAVKCILGEKHLFKFVKFFCFYAKIIFCNIYPYPMLDFNILPANFLFVINILLYALCNPAFATVYYFILKPIVNPAYTLLRLI